MAQTLTVQLVSRRARAVLSFALLGATATGVVAGFIDPANLKTYHEIGALAGAIYAIVSGGHRIFD